MRYVILSLICFLLAVTLSAQDKVNTDGYNVFYYKNGKKSSEGTMVNGKPDGYWKNYYESGNIKSEGKRVAFLLDSVWTFYNDSSRVVMRITYTGDKKNGKRYTYHGKETVEENFVNDVKQGYSYRYFPDGSMMTMVNFIDGLEEGTGKEFSPDGRVVKLIEYQKGYVVDIENINRIDSKGRKQNKWKYFYDSGGIRLECNYKDDVLDGYYKEYSEKGDLVNTFKYVDGVKQENVAELAKLDVKTEYYPNRKPKIIASYKNNVPQGIRREFSLMGEVIKAYIFDSGKVIAEGIIDKEGIREGPWKDLFPDGTLKAAGNYDKGKKVGEWKYYHKNGQLEQTGSYNSEGKEEGTWTWYYSTGELVREENYINGLIEGIVTEFDEKGQVISEGEYIEGNREGKWKFNYGDVKEEGEFQLDMRHGYWRSWYNNGNLSYEGEFIENNPNKVHIWYWDNGNKKLEGNYSNGLKNGDWISYDHEGNPFLITTYQNGVEQKYDGIKVIGDEEEVTQIED